MQLLTTNPLLTLFLIIGLGLLLGEITIAKISLGTSGVIFIALAAGHLGLSIPQGIGALGLAIFVYCVGIGAGARFFGALKREGSTLAKLALFTVLTGTLISVAMAWFLDLSPEMATGIFAGAMTSTPALASAMEAAGGLSEQVVVGYGIAYPFGVIGVVLFVQLVPRLLRLKLDGPDEEELNDKRRIERILLEVTNANLFGKKVHETAITHLGDCQVSRILRGERLEPIAYDDVLQEGSLILLVGTPRSIRIATEYFGKVSEKDIRFDIENERQDIVVTSGAIAGKTLEQLDLLKKHGVVVTRVNRMDFRFIPSPDTKLERRDSLTVVGSKRALTNFATHVGHRALAHSETSLISFALGLVGGILLGLVPLPIGEESIRLGLSGGPLMVALVLGHFGKVGGVVGYIPKPTRLLLQEMGLVFFLADAGIKGGATLVNTIATEGVKVLLAGAAITLLPIILGSLYAKFVLKLSFLQNLGGVCGAMTSTPALGALAAGTAPNGARIRGLSID